LAFDTDFNLSNNSDSDTNYFCVQLEYHKICGGAVRFAIIY